MKLAVVSWFLGALVAVFVIDRCESASMPNELKGEYTFGTTEQCGYLKVDDAGVRTDEDLSCVALAIKNLRSSSGEQASFEAELLCQVDDPKKIRVTGIFEYKKLRNVFVLAMHLAVHPSDRRRISLPTLQLFAKCGSR